MARSDMTLRVTRVVWEGLLLGVVLTAGCHERWIGAEEYLAARWPVGLS